MSQLSLDSAPDKSGTLVCGLTPSGYIDVRQGAPNESDDVDQGPHLSAAVEKRIVDAFNLGRGHGVLQLGASELLTAFHMTLSYWCDIGRSFLVGI